MATVRDRVKARTVGGSLVVTLTKDIAAAVGVSDGDAILMEVASPGRLMLRKEAEEMPLQHEIELEVDVLRRQRAAVAAKREMALHEYETQQPSYHGLGLTDGDIFAGTLKEYAIEESELDVAIAEKRLELFRAGGHLEDDESDARHHEE